MRWILGLVMLFLVWGRPVAPAFPAPAATFRAEVQVAGDYITLGHLAELPPEAAGALAPLPIWTAPPPGQIYTLTREFLSYRLTQLGLPELAEGDLPPVITVRQAGVALEPEEIARTFQRCIREHSPFPEKNLRIQVYPLEEPVLLPEAGVSLEAMPPKNGRLLGEVTLEMAVLLRGQPLKRLRVTGRVSLEREVVCALRPLKPQQVIGPGDVALLRREVSQMNGHEYFTALDQVMGRTLARPLGPQEILTSRHLSQQPLIQRGDEVTVLLEDQGLAIRTKGVAQEPGYPGKAIRLLNPKSRKEFQAQVVDAKTVRVTL